MAKCNLCGDECDGTLILISPEIRMQDGSDMIVCQVCLNYFVEGDYEELTKRLKNKVNQESLDVAERKMRNTIKNIEKYFHEKLKIQFNPDDEIFFRTIFERKVKEIFNKFDEYFCVKDDEWYKELKKKYLDGEKIKGTKNSSRDFTNETQALKLPSQLFEDAFKSLGDEKCCVHPVMVQGICVNCGKLVGSEDKFRCVICKKKVSVKKGSGLEGDVICDSKECEIRSIFRGMKNG